MGISYNTSLVRDGLVLHLDAANPKSYPGTGTTWYDLSGNGNNASLLGTAAYAMYNSSGYFDHSPGDVYYGATSSSTTGSTTYGAYWQVPANTVLNPSGGWTVSGFLNISGDQSSNGGGWFVLGNADLKVHLEPINTTFRANANNGWSRINYSTTPYYNTFHMYSFVFTQTSGTYGTDAGSLSLYIDGALKVTDSGYIPGTTTNYQINLGRRMGHLYHFMKAKAANYHYYTRPLSQLEIKQNFEALRGRYGL